MITKGHCICARARVCAMNANAFIVELIYLIAIYSSSAPLSSFSFAPVFYFYFFALRSVGVFIFIYSRNS